MRTFNDPILQMQIASLKKEIEQSVGQVQSHCKDALSYLLLQQRYLAIEQALKEKNCG